jgi:hypothetical protein
MVKPRRRFNVPLSVLLATFTLVGLGLLDLVTDDVTEDALAQPVIEQSGEQCETIPLPRGRMVVVPRAVSQPRAAAVLPGGAGLPRSPQAPSSRTNLRPSTCL